MVAWTGGFSANMAVADPRNFGPEAEDSICRFVSAYIRSLESAGVTLALENYITLACPDAISLRRTLNRLPPCIGAVLDPPNLTPVARFAERDTVLREMVTTLAGRITIVHLKDFRLNPAGDGYVLPPALDGKMNYPLFAHEILSQIAPDVPLIAEHAAPAQFGALRTRLLRVFDAATGSNPNF
jgi:sugar phosphate isomerase/epimerase